MALCKIPTSTFKNEEEVILLIGMFHAMTSEEKKSNILKSLSSSSSQLKLVISSSLGCGVNTCGVEYVVHFGPSFELVDY